MWGTVATIIVVALSACSSQVRATSPKEVRRLAGSAQAAQARQKTESRLRDVVHAYADRTPLKLGMLVLRDNCIGGRAKQWIDSNGADTYKIRCSIQVTAYYGADPKKIVSVLDGVLAAGDKSGSAIPFTHQANGQFVNYYRHTDGHAEVPQLSLPSHTLSWDPVRDDRPSLTITEPDQCVGSDPPVRRCVREREMQSVTAIRKRYGMVFKLELTAPDYYTVSKSGQVHTG
ncbi:hypothetical protein [Streptomyces sp. L2]|uniref:hypothetical protein n=1 Tax=Streptomyces sp. L2 TaxID=2162665 RepID=UPI0010128042|nr:hypothetical protein [Streptomyces sp. L2]